MTPDLNPGLKPTPWISLTLSISLCLPALCPQLEVGIATHIQKLIGVKESVLPEDVSNFVLFVDLHFTLCIWGCEKSLG